MTAMSKPAPAMVRRRRFLFIAVSLAVSLCVAVVAAEMILRVQAAYHRGGESMAPGLIQYDRERGWTLQRNWKGTHKHRDFEVRYQIAAHGFRGPWPQRDQEVQGEQDSQASQDPPGEQTPDEQQASERNTTHKNPTKKNTTQCIAFLGDSFTFGLGADEASTFSRRFESRGTDSGRQVINLGVPGYSTDQEVLLLESVILQVPIDHVVLVVCLINDVFDNERLFPLQAMQGKPRFRLQEDGTLRLENVPVPPGQKTAADMQENLASLVTPDSQGEPNAFSQWLGGHEIARRLGFFQPKFETPPGFYDDRFSEALTLFDALVDRARHVTEQSGATFTLALLPGRSFVEDASGYSAHYQDYLRGSLSQRSSRSGIAVIDLATPLREAQQAGQGPFYHPNDGHLNATGHEKVAELLESAF